MKSVRLNIAALAGTGFCIFMSACGGGSGGSTTPPPPTNAITSISVSPNAATIGAQVQFTANVSGTGSFSSAVKWSVLGTPGSTMSAGTISTTGLYITPYPAPPTVSVVATSTQDTTKSGSAMVTLNPPVAGSGPALTVDAGAQTHTINPYIYGMNYYALDPTAAKAVNLSIDRWGGNATSRYNYLLDATSSASDWYFENQVGLPGGTTANSSFNKMVTDDAANGTKTLGTVPVMGWVAKDTTSCSFPTSTYPNQQKVDSGRGCGNGFYEQGVGGCTNSSGCNITGIDPNSTSMPVDPTFVGNWVKFLVGKFGTAASGGVAVYDLDNEPSWWNAVHRDVHSAPFTYDEVTTHGLAAAEAIKTADPTAEVSGPVVDYWWNYFYSKKDIESGWGTGPCYEPWQNPVDRNAHGGVPLIEYYLQQFKSYEIAHNVRLLDYVDLHTYFAPDNLAFSTGGDTDLQKVRLDSTRVFWDPTYIDPSFNQPNYIGDANYTASCNTPTQSPQVIPMMKTWVANDYPGTKMAITEYNWGGLEHINGALAQADILGIFGREGLDLGTLWGPPDPGTQVPGVMAFETYRNYDGAGSTFGDKALTSTSTDQSKLSVYGALRTRDDVVTVVVLNKTYGDLTTTLSLANLIPGGAVKAFLYSSAHLAGIVAQPDVTVTAPTGAGTTSTITTTFRAQSITIFIVPKA
jgi:Glycoside hydrolase family 44